MAAAALLLELSLSQAQSTARHGRAWGLAAKILRLRVGKMTKYRVYRRRAGFLQEHVVSAHVTAQVWHLRLRPSTIQLGHARHAHVRRMACRLTLEHMKTFLLRLPNLTPRLMT